MCGEFVEGGAPALRRAGDHRGGHGRIGEGVGLHNVHSRVAGGVDEIHLGIGAEQWVAGEVGGVQVEHQAAGGCYFDEVAAGPV